jgi:hypothetical protein
MIRGARALVWIATAALAIYTVADFERRMMRETESAFRQTTLGSIGLLELAGLFIVAFALDRCLQLAERREAARPQA